MTTLRAVPRDLYSWAYSVLEDKHELTRIDLDALGEGAEFTLRGRVYRLAPPSLYSGAFILQSGNRTLASAERPGVFARGIGVDMGGRRYVLEAQEIGSRRYVVRLEGEVVGRIGPDGLLSRKVAVELPAEMDAAQKVFLLWLVLLQWRKAAQGKGF
jgi:hypothetical protein